MKFLAEYRDPRAAEQLLKLIHQRTTRPWSLMEICGGQSHTIIKYGLDELLPRPLTLIHGPGCPVCVTPIEMVDQAIRLAARPDVILCSFGDMLRVPGSQSDLLRIKAAGGDVRVVYSPLDGLRIATEHPDRQVIFFAVGFETTAPANAMAVWQARRRGVTNFSLLVSQVLVPPAIEALLSSGDHRMDGLLAAGHVCMVMGVGEYEQLAAKHTLPIVVTGFEPLDLLAGIYRCVDMLEAGRCGVENEYARVVRPEGNRRSQELLREVFEVTDRKWRGVGVIKQSGYRLRDEFAAFDASRRFSEPEVDVSESSLCLSGDILRGLIKPPQCPQFRVTCSPDNPLGATMVSSEGACAAYFNYGRLRWGASAVEEQGDD